MLSSEMMGIFGLVGVAIFAFLFDTIYFFAKEKLCRARWLDGDMCVFALFSKGRFVGFARTPRDALQLAYEIECETDLSVNIVCYNIENEEGKVYLPEPIDRDSLWQLSIEPYRRAVCMVLRANEKGEIVEVVTFTNDLTIASNAASSVKKCRLVGIDADTFQKKAKEM